MGKRMVLTFAAALVMAAFALRGIAIAQPTPTPTPAKSFSNVASVTYFVGGGSSTSTDVVRVVNQSGTDLCALYYVFDANQELSECCGCEISNSGETSTSLLELTENPGNGVIATEGSILLVSSAAIDSASPECDAAAPKPTPSLQAWSTHTQTATEITEEEFTPITLTTPNLRNAASLCGFIEGNGSGKGVCDCSSEG